MSKKIKSDYPKRITGTLNVSADEQLSIPELELSFSMDIDSKGNRRIVSCGARMPSKFTEADLKPIYFEQSKCVVDYNGKDEVYSIAMTSIDPFIDRDSNLPIPDSEIEKYCRMTEDMDLMVLVNVCQFLWTSLADNLDIIDMSGKFIKAVIKAFHDNINDEDIGSH
jgi:hypothetical protein